MSRKFFVKAKPGAKSAKAVKISENHFEISVKERPEGGKANAAVIRALAEYFDIAPSRLKIISGQTFRNKIIEIL